MTRGALVLVVLLLAGCTTLTDRLTFRLYWERPNAGLAEFERDSGQCIADAVAAKADESQYKACMRSKQWRRVTVATPGATQFRGPENAGEFAYPPNPRVGQR